MKTPILFASFAVAALAFTACGSSSSSSGFTRPEITQVAVSDSPVPQNNDGSYTVDLDISFQDDLDVVTYNFDSDAANLHVTNPLKNPTPSGTLALTIDLPNGTRSGTLDFFVTLTDSNNDTSDAVAGTAILD